MMYSEAPQPSDATEAGRVNHTRLRRRMLDGQWAGDLRTHQRTMLGLVRDLATGDPSLAVCALKSVTRALSVLYDEPYRIMHGAAQPRQLAELSNRVRLSGLFGTMPSVQQYTLGLREMFVRAHVDADGRLHYRPVTPDMLRGWASMDAPEIPLRIWELRPRVRQGTDQPVWTIDDLDVSDPSAPRYAIWLCKDGSFDIDPSANITAEFLSGDALSEWTETGWFKQWTDRNGMGIMPGVMYHARRTGDRLFDPFEGRELVDASLDFGVLHQMVITVFKDASHPQRYMANLRPLGMDLLAGEEGRGRRFEVASDPRMILMLETDLDKEGAGQPMIGQWQPGGDIAKMEETLSNMMARIAADADVPPSDIQRLGGTARSGAAISLTNEGKRKAQRRYMGVFRDFDERLIGLSATMLNRQIGTDYPEWGYRVAYQQIPLSPEEQDAKLRLVETQLERGLISLVEAYMELHPGVTAEEAARAIPSSGASSDRSEDVSEAIGLLASAIAALDSESPDVDAVRSAVSDAADVLATAFEVDISEEDRAILEELAQ